MDIHELRENPHLSISSINTYMDCGLLYKLSKVDKHKPAFTSDALILGKELHRVLADFNRERMNQNMMAFNEISQIFERYCIEADRWDNVAYLSHGNLKTMIKEGIRLLEVFFKNFADHDFKVLAVEEPFQVSITGLEIPMIGIIDLIEEDECGTVIISDYKTSSKSYSMKQVENDDQLTTYQIAVKSNGFKNRQILLRFDCLIKTQAAKYEQYYTIRTFKDESRMMAKAKQIWEGVKNKIFIPNTQSWKCINCAYKQHCNDWFEQQEMIL